MAQMSVISKLLWGFIAIIIGAVLIGVIASGSLAVTTAKENVVANETTDFTSARIANNDLNESVSFTLANANTGWKTEPDECKVSTGAVVYINATTLGVVDTDYTLSDDGVLVILNNSDTAGTVGVPDNSSLTSYSYCSDGYLNSGWGRNVLNLVAGFFALAILGVGIGLFYSVGKETGII